MGSKDADGRELNASIGRPPRLHRFMTALRKHPSNNTTAQLTPCCIAT